MVQLGKIILIGAIMIDIKPELLHHNDTKEDKIYFVRIHLLIFLTILIYIPIFYFTGAFLSFELLTIIAAIMNPVVFLFHKNNHPNLAKISLVLACNAGVYFTSYGLGHQINSQLYCFALLILTLILFNRKNNKLLILGSFISVATAWILLDKTPLYFPIIVPPHIVPINLLERINFLGSSLMLSMFVYLFIEDSKKQQARIQFLLGTSNVNFIALKESEKKLEHIMNLIEENAIVVITNKTGEILKINQKFCDVSGYSEKELIGQNIRIISSGSHPKTFFKELWTTIKEGKTWGGDIVNRDKNGNNYYVKMAITSLKDIDGNINEYLSISVNQTHRIQTENLLAEIQQIARIGNWSYDIADNKLKFSPIMGEFFLDDFHKNSPSFEKFILSLHENDQIRCIEVFEKCINTELEIKIKIRSVNAGKLIWIHILGQCKKDKTGKVISLHGTGQDITESVKVEEILQIERMKVVHYVTNTSK